MVRGVMPNSRASSEMVQVCWPSLPASVAPLGGALCSVPAWPIDVLPVYVNVISCHKDAPRQIGAGNMEIRMNPNEQRLEYPFGDTLAEPGSAFTVAEGVKWVRLPLPFVLDHINVWLLRDRFEGREGWTIVDCGVARPEVKAMWEQVFENALEGLPVLRVIVTHMHPDHIGLASWLCERWNAPLWMTMTDYFQARNWALPPGSGQVTGGPNGESAVRHFSRHGLRDPEALEQIRQRAGYYPSLAGQPPHFFRRIMHGDRIVIGEREWQVIVGYGHAPEHASLYCDSLKVLISGDMVLPRISTNVSVFDFEPEANPLPLYLKSLERYAHLAPDTLVLPS